MNITKKEITVMRRSEKAMKRILACVILCMSWIFFVTTRTEAATINSVPLATDDVWVSGSVDTLQGNYKENISFQQLVQIL